MCKERSIEKTSAESPPKRVSACVFSFLYFIGAILLLPLFFCWFYYFTEICTRYRPFDMLKAVTQLGAIASWVSMPLLLLATIGVRKMIIGGARFRIIFFVCLAIGYIWLAAWNFAVEPLFGYFKAFIPLCFCCSLGIMPGFFNRYWIRDFKK